MIQTAYSTSTTVTSMVGVNTSPPHFPNMYEQLMSFKPCFTRDMTLHIEHHQNQYLSCPEYLPQQHAPSFQTLTPNKGVDQSVMIDGEYRLDVTKDGKNESHFKLYDKNGKELAGEWGDPHLTGKNGEAVGDLQCNHVLTLPNGAKVGVRVSSPDGGAPVPGKADVVTELTAVSANGMDAMNFNMNVGSDKPTTGTPIAGYLGENFIAETLSDHGAFLGAQLGVSKNGGFVDPLTGLPMTAEGLKGIDLMNPDAIVRSKAENLAMAQTLHGQGYVTPYYHRLFCEHNFSSYTKEMHENCIDGLQLMLARMRMMLDNGLGCACRLPNYIDRNRGDMLLNSYVNISSYSTQSVSIGLMNNNF